MQNRKSFFFVLFQIFFIVFISATAKASCNSVYAHLSSFGAEMLSLSKQLVNTESSIISPGGAHIMLELLEAAQEQNYQSEIFKNAYDDVLFRSAQVKDGHHYSLWKSLSPIKFFEIINELNDSEFFCKDVNLGRLTNYFSFVENFGWIAAKYTKSGQGLSYNLSQCLDRKRNLSDQFVSDYRKKMNRPDVYPSVYDLELFLRSKLSYCGISDLGPRP